MLLFKNLKKRFIFVFIFCIVSSLFYYFLFYPIYFADSITFPFALHPFDICKKYPDGWLLIKKLSIVFSFLSELILSNFIFSSLPMKNFDPPVTQEKEKTDINDFILEVGENVSGTILSLPSRALFQNILITGTIGTGKTSSAMYPFTKQIISYQASHSSQKIGALILDVKGNYYNQVSTDCKKFNRMKDLIVIDLQGKITYNPLDKPDLKPSVLANRLKTILLLFSPNNSESFWLDKVEQLLAEAIKLCRIYNDGYVTFEELHKLITMPNYYEEKIAMIREKFISGILSKDDCFNLISSLHFFEKEFLKLDNRTLSILKSEVTRITGAFISDKDILHTFSPKKKEITFHGFSEVINQGKIVVLNMNISEYRNLSKIIAAYLKLDFQTEVLRRLSLGKVDRMVAFISDEYHEYVTSTDADFFAQSREAKCINIVATQSYNSLLNTLNNKYTVSSIIQNLINKLWFRTDDLFTVEEAQKQIGKEEKIKYSKTISENSKETNFNYFTGKFNSLDSNLSESINSYSQLDFIYDTNYFTQKLETFHCIAFLSTGNKILSPQELKMFPYFIERKEV